MRQIDAVHCNPPVDAAPDIAEHCPCHRHPDWRGCSGRRKCSGWCPARYRDARHPGPGRAPDRESVGFRHVPDGRPWPAIRNYRWLFADRHRWLPSLKQHLDQIAAHAIARGRVVFHLQPRLGGLGAGRHAARAALWPDLHRADPAAALMAQAFHIAQPRDVDARRIGRLHDGLAGLAGDGDAVDAEMEGFAHCAEILVEDVGPPLGDAARPGDGGLDVEGRLHALDARL